MKLYHGSLETVEKPQIRLAMNREITDNNLYLLLPSKVSLFAQVYVKEHGGPIIDAIRKFYHSNTYKNLEKENTKLWHYGAVALYEEFINEKQVGG